MKYKKITISGKICTGKSSLFKKLKDALGWPTFSTGAFFREYAKKHHLELNKAQEQTQKLTLQVDDMVRSKLSGEGHLLVDAWLGGYLAQNIPGVLKILLTAPDEIRFSRFANREQIALSKAKEEVKSRDLSWLEKVRRIHNYSDFFDPKCYDLVIDTSKVSTEEAVKEVLKSLS